LTQDIRQHFGESSMCTSTSPPLTLCQMGLHHHLQWLQLLASANTSVGGASPSSSATTTTQDWLHRRPTLSETQQTTVLVTVSTLRQLGCKIGYTRFAKVFKI
jgi:hypothetical protein